MPPLDPLYVLARRVLLDALAALDIQRDSAILVGAQAVYIHTGSGDLAVAEYTTDADLAVDPRDLKSRPLLQEALQDAKFHVDPAEVGRWTTTRDLSGRPVKVVVDLMVPEALAGAGRRAVRLGDHGNRTARRARGLEAAIVDNSRITIPSLEADDRRTFEISVAGPAALIVAKAHKIYERLGGTRQEDKDALDLLRILRKVEATNLGDRLTRLAKDEFSRVVTLDAVMWLKELFSSPKAEGSRMAGRAAQLSEPPDTIAASCSALVEDLVREYSARMTAAP